MSIKNHKVTLKQATALATLLGCSALYLPLTAEAATASATTSWAVSRVASESLGSYCTIAQKYSDETVLTFAQNVKGEYSLALDFKDQKFTAGKQQSISISIDGGKTKTFEATPQTENTVVLGIGRDTDFIKQVKAAKKITVKAGTDSSDFGLSEVASGQKSLGDCVDALQTSADKATDVAAEKTVTKSMAPVIRKTEMTMKPVEMKNDKEPSVEGLLAAMPKPSADITPVQDMPVTAEAEIIPIVPAVKAKAADIKVEAKDDKTAGLQADIASLRDENARLSRALSEQRKAFENKQSATDGAALSEMREKLDAAKADNVSLNNQLAQLNTKVSTAEVAAKDAAKSGNESMKLTETVKALQQENQTLKNQIQIYANVKDTKATSAEALAKLQTENAELKKSITDLQAAPKDVKAANPDAVAKLQTENADLKQVIADLKTAPKERPVATTSSASDDEVNKLRADNRKLHNDVDMLTSEKTALQTQTATLQKDMESKQLKMSGGSWDLEQATRRYQESQREIVRLGSIIQSQDVKCANEKKDIEYMLFDPAIAAKAQIAMLNSLEDQVKEKDDQLKSSQSTVAAAQTKESAEKDAKIAELQNSVSQSQNQLAQVQAQLTTEQANAQKINASMQSQQTADQAASVAALQMQVQQANQKIIQLQNQLSSTNQASLRAASLADVAPAAAGNPGNPVNGLMQQASFTPAQAPVSAPASNVRFKSIEEFSSLLKNSGIAVRGSVQAVKGGDPSNYRAYSWKTDSLYGSVEMKKVSDASQFEDTVDQYLSRAKSRCSGDFAAVPSPVKAGSMSQSKAYEIACVGQSASSSASVLFTYGDNITTTVAHEGRAEAMDLAIDARDKISARIN